MVNVIPVKLDNLPVPIRVVSEAQEKYVNLLHIESNIIAPALEREIIVMQELGSPSKDFYKLMKEVKDFRKLQLDYLKFIKELTLDVQATNEAMVADLVLEIAKSDPDLKKRLKPIAAAKAREYLQNRMVEVVVDTAANV